jgi:hypothetical protein
MPPAFHQAMARVVDGVTEEHETPSRYMKSLPKTAGNFPMFVEYQLISVGLAFQFVSCCPESTCLL